MHVKTAAVVFALLVALVGCSRSTREDAQRDDSVVEMLGARNMFMGGVITPAPSSGEFLVIIEVTPAEHDDADKMGAFLRARRPVSLRLREEPSEPPILIRDVTSRGGAIIRCKTLDEAKRVIDRLHAWPSR